MSNKILTAIIATLFLLFLIIVTVRFLDVKKELKQTDESLLRMAKGYEFEIIEKDSTIAIQDQLLISKDSKLAKLGDSISSLKKLSGQIQIKTITKIEKDTIFVDRLIKTDTGTFLKLPYSLSNQSKWYGYTFTLDTLNNAIMDELWFKSSTHIAWGIEDHGNFIRNLFKENNPIIHIRQENPFSSNIEIKNVIYEDFNPKRFKLGFHLGYGITPKGFQPYAGFGLGFNLIK